MDSVLKKYKNNLARTEASVRSGVWLSVIFIVLALAIYLASGVGTVFAICVFLSGWFLVVLFFDSLNLKSIKQSINSYDDSNNNTD